LPRTGADSRYALTRDIVTNRCGAVNGSTAFVLGEFPIARAGSTGSWRDLAVV